MKHLLLVEHESKLDSFISEYSSVEDRFCVYQCKFDEFESLACSERFDGGVIVLIPTWREIKLEVLKEKFPGRKIMLMSAMISDVTVRDLQHNKEVIDLFFKAPVGIEQIDTMYDAFTSAQTASVSIGVDDDDDDGGLELDSASGDEEVSGLALPETEDEGGLELDGSDDHTIGLDLDSGDEVQAEEIDVAKATNVVDLAMELEGIEGGILGVDNTDGKENEQGEDLMSLLDGDGEADSQEEYNSQEISRILKTEVLLGELQREKDVQSSKAAEQEKKKVTQEFADPSLLMSGEEASGSVPLNILVDPSEAAPVPAPAPAAPEESQPAPAASLGVTAEEVQKMLRHREEDYLKLLSRNEILEEENRLVREKIISLEQVASSASMVSKNKSLESDENKIRISVLRRHHSEEVEKLQNQNKMFREKLSYFKENLEQLTGENKKLLKKNLVDVKMIHSREEELEEKIQLMKADVSSQIKNRENKIIELKRKIDLLQFDLKDSEEREKELSAKISVLEDKLYKLKKVLGESIERLDDSFYERPVQKVKL